MKRLNILFLIAGAIILLSSCTLGNYNCEGQIEIVNTIPDTTLVLGREPFRRDVFEEPVVFRHTEGTPMSILVTSKDGGVIVSATGERDEVTGLVSKVEVTPVKVGETKVFVTATGGECPDHEVQTSFEVTVVDSSSAK